MRLGFVCVENVHNLDAAGFQVIRNERAVTAPPHRFCAHNDGRPCFASQIKQALDTFGELLCLHVIGVTAK